MRFEIVSTEASHLRRLAPTLRAEDVAEVEAAGLTSQTALWRSWRQAVVARTAIIDGEVAASWGCGGCPLGHVGRPWLLTSPVAERAKVAFIREGRQEIAEMLALFPELRGYVDARYVRALRLLETLGFSLSGEFSFGTRGVMFRRYSMRRN